MMEIIFKLDEMSKIITNVEELSNLIHCCTSSTIYFLCENKKIVLSTDAIRENMQVFNTVLRKTLNNELHLHESIKNDIGYLLNEEFQNKPGLIYKKLEGRDYWVGFDYLVWNHQFATWLYNDDHGSIILEITPIYPYHFSEPQDDITYDQWIQDYKPYLITKISKNIAQEWLRQSTEILKLIEENIKKFENKTI